MSSFKITRWDSAGIMAAVDVGQAVMAKALDEEFRLAITSNVWSWPRSPSPRDIVDTKRLHDSQKMRLNGRRGVLWSWAVPYARFVHDGVVLRNGTVMPARPWTKRALEMAKLDVVFADAFKGAKR